MTAAPRQHVERRGKRAVVGHRRSRGDDREIVADDIGHRQREHVPARRERELAALDRGQMLAHGVQLVDVGPLLHERASGPLLRVERNLRRRQRHQRRPSARQQHEQQIAFARRGRHFERASCAGHAAAVRKRMPGVIPGSRRRKRDRGSRDRVAARSRAACGAARRPRRRRPRSSARRPCPRRSRQRRRAAKRVAHVGVFERTADEPTGVHAVDGRAQYCQEIVSEVGSGGNQCTCRGSAQAESPVTTSNCRRSRLTT